MKLSLSALFVLAVAVIAEKRVSYDGAKAIRIEVGEDVTSVLNIITQLKLETWKGLANGVPVAGGHVDLVVPASKVEKFTKLAGNIKTEVMHEDLGASIAEESTPSALSSRAVSLAYFNAYHPYAEHLTFLRDLVAAYPSNAEIVTSGTSVQGRVITGIHFWGTGGKGSKPAIVLHGGVHAREWITPMTTEYFAYYMLTNYAANAEIKGFVDKYDYYLFPVVNPDGFVYTQTTNRLWRKNRQTVSSSTCIGRDINRNWPFQWAATGGASTDPCNETYKGAAAGDSPENKGLVAYINALKAGKGVQMYWDIHSYSQLFMTPYGYSCTAVPTGNTVLQSLARGTAAAIRAVYGTTYGYGPICTTIYKTTGSSVDYINDVTKAKYTFTIELRDTGTNGFVLPPAQILPTGVETWAGLRYLLINMVSL